MDSRVELMIVADRIQRDIAAAQQARCIKAAQPPGGAPSAGRRRGARWLRAHRHLPTMGRVR